MSTYIKNLKPMHLVLIASILMLCSCAKHYMGATYSDPYGFFSGVLHGFVFPFALISKIISWGSSIFDINIFTDIEFVGRPNTGLFFYYIGYFFGLSAWIGSATK